jgi:4-nitrophenyl phosphatase
MPSVPRPKAYFFDLDGTVYRGSAAVPHAPESIAELRRRGAAIRFLTNNSAATPVGTAEKLDKLGIPALPEEVVTSGMAAGAYLKSQGLRRLFVIGEPGLTEVLGEYGLSVENDRPGAFDAVLCGICRSFTYGLLSEAMGAIRSGARFVATNPDPTYPLEGGRLEPGAGALVAALRTCSGVEPYVCGKPQPDMVRLALESCRVAPHEALLVGDRADTDLAAAEAAGVAGALVLTGVTTSPVEGYPSMADLRELLD